MELRSRIRFSSSIAIVCCALLACGDDGTGGGADSGTAPGRGGRSGGTGAGSGGSFDPNCLDTAELDEVVAPRRYSEGSVIYRMELDGDDLYYSTIDAIYRVPVEGGEPDVLYMREFALGVAFWVRDDDLLVLEGASTLVSVPKDGGAPVELGEVPYRISGSLDGRVDMIVDGDLAYAKSEVGGLFADDPLMITYFEIDLTTIETREITVGEIGEFSTLVKLGDALYTASDDPEFAEPADAGITLFQPDLLYRIPIEGGEPEVVPLSGDPMSFNVIGADDAQLFLIVGSEDDIGRAGIYSVGPEGGTPTQLVESFVLFNATFEHDRTETRNLIRDLDTVYAVPLGRADAEQLFCVDGDVHSMAATDEEVYVGLFDGEGEEASVVRVPLR